MSLLRASIVAVALSAGLGTAAFAQTGTTAPSQQPPACSCPGHQAQAGGMGTQAGTANMPMHGGGMCGHMAQLQMSQMANVTVQDTPQGAIVRFDAKNPSQVNDIRGMAQRMSSCMNTAAQAPTPPTTTPSK